MGEELKPCPFCGGDAKHNDGGNSTYGRFWWAVGCPECDVVLRDREVWGANSQLVLPAKECFARWNTRADAAFMEEVREVLRGLIDDVQAWVDAIQNNGTSWDDWDHHYKGFAHDGGLDGARALLEKMEGK
jgi:hypothetical protein